MIESPGQREKIILKMLSDKGKIHVSELSKSLGVSEVTIRSDLRGLEEQGYISRSRGGAGPSLHQNILKRQKLNVAEKLKIAKAGASLVKNGDRIMIEAGTTTALLVRCLLAKSDVHIVTNSTLIISYARLKPSLQITMTGGEFRRETESMVGPIALGSLNSYNVRLAFVGTDGFSLKNGMTTHLRDGGEIVKAMCKRAEETWLLADSSKYGKSGFVNMLDLKSIYGIITDSKLSEEARAELKKAKINLVLV